MPDGVDWKRKKNIHANGKNNLHADNVRSTRRSITIVSRDGCTGTTRRQHSRAYRRRRTWVVIIWAWRLSANTATPPRISLSCKSYPKCRRNSSTRTERWEFARKCWFRCITRTRTSVRTVVSRENTSLASFQVSYPSRTTGRRLLGTCLCSLMNNIT